jgi:hypothetical protein
MAASGSMSTGVKKFPQKPQIKRIIGINNNSDNSSPLTTPKNLPKMESNYTAILLKRGSNQTTPLVNNQNGAANIIFTNNSPNGSLPSGITPNNPNFSIQARNSGGANNQINYANGSNNINLNNYSNVNNIGYLPTSSSPNSMNGQSSPNTDR